MTTTTALRNVSFWIVIFCILQLVGCKTTQHFTSPQQDGPPHYNVDASKIPDAIPKSEPLSRYGNPKSYVVYGHRYYVMKSSQGYKERGFASWYGSKFHAKRTSSGERYSMLTMTAAHKTLPLPTYVQVVNLKNGRRVIVKVNDRGPFHANRIIDLSYVAAKKLGISGTGLVEVSAIGSHYRENGPLTHTAKLGHKPHIFLQIGAFSQLDNAERIRQHITQLTSAPVNINKGTRGDEEVYRVQIGPLADVDVTDRLHDELKKLGLGEPVTVIQ